MAEKQPEKDKAKSKDKTKVESKKTEPKEEGKQDGLTEEELKKQLKERDGTISSLTKKVDETNQRFEELEGRLKSVAGVSEEEDEQESDATDLIEKLGSEVSELKKQNALQKLTAGMVDEDGEPLPDSIKNKALESIDVTNLSPEEAVDAVKRQAKTLHEIYNEAKTVSDKTVEASKNRTTANEYIDREITIIK